jgi:uncharacterized membrane protein
MPKVAVATRLNVRHQFIDAARGIAMLFVLLSHFSFSYFPNQTDWTPTVLRMIGMVSSPTFMIINGLLIGFLCRTRRDQFEHLRTAFIDRGLLLLTVGHLLILGSHVAWYTTRFLSITDTVAVCMIVGPWLAMRFRPGVRLALGLAVYSLSWIVVVSWHPHQVLFEAVKETLFGTFSSTIYYYAFPVLPWLGLDLAASALGSRLGEYHERGEPAAMQRLLKRTALSGLVAAVMINLGYHLAKYLSHGSAFVVSLHTWASPFHKDPPAPDYLLFYGALGLLLLSATMHLLERGYVRWLTDRAIALGQTSFVVFMLQFYVYFTGLALIREHLPFRFAWPVYFAASVALIALIAFAWHRRGFNRYLTVGYRHLQNSSWNFRLPIGSPIEAVGDYPRKHPVSAS